MTSTLATAVASSLTPAMRDPIYSLPLHDIGQMRALAGLLRAFIDDNAPDTNDGQDWKPDPEYQGIVAAWCHLDGAIKAHDNPVPRIRVETGLGDAIDEAVPLYIDAR